MRALCVATSIAALAALDTSPAPAQPARALVVCVAEQSSRAPLVGAVVTILGRARNTRHLTDACGTVPLAPDSLLVSRVGYHTAHVAVAPRSGASDTLRVYLTSIASGTDARAATTLRAVDVRADAVPYATTTMAARDARERGASSTAGLLALLPFTTLRSARGETTLSLRGARREQVVVTLDGVPLNDPATGVADVADVPLVALATASAVPGADPLGAGSGATGGVVALTTTAQPMVAVHGGAFGRASAEATVGRVIGTTRVHVTGSVRRSANDFAFNNTITQPATREIRTNNDEQREAVLLGAVGGAWQASVLATHSDRGMVGPINVRTYDADRSRTIRVVARGQRSVGSQLITLGVRTLEQTYRDPTRPALDSRARVVAADADWRGATTIAPASTLSWRAGLGADALRADGNLRQQRQRAFAALDWRVAASDARVTGTLGVRTDAIERSGVQPTGSAIITWRLRDEASSSARGVGVRLTGRVAQAVRVPTLYDLWFASPQRLSVRALSPERVPLDASFGASARTHARGWVVDGDVQLVARDTRDAIVWFPGNFGWSPANVGREHLRGVEARIAATHHTFAWSAWSSYYDATLRTGGLRIPTPYVPNAQGGMLLRVPSRVAVFAANWRWQGRRPYTAGPRNPAFELPTVALLDLSAAHTWSVGRTQLLASLALDNATDVSWQSVRGFPMPGRSWTAGISITPALPVAPR